MASNIRKHLLSGLLAIVALGMVAPMAHAQAFKVTQVIPSYAFKGMKPVGPMWSATPDDPAQTGVVSMADIGDPVVLNTNRLEWLAARAAQDPAGQEAPPAPDAADEPEQATATASSADSSPIVVRYPRPGSRARAAWTYQPRSRSYSGTRAPRYNRAHAPRRNQTQAPRRYTRRPTRRFGYQASVEAYSYHLRQVRDLEADIEQRIDQLDLQQRQ